MAEWIQIESMDGHRLAAWQVAPEAAPRGAIVVIQEIFGVNAHIRRVAEGFAQAGYLVVAPCLFERVQSGVELGYDEAGIARGRDLVAAVGFDNAVRDVAAAAAYAGRAGKVGAVGYCWGGTVALLSNTRLKLPAVSYYGGRSVPFLHERPGAALLLHFGERDTIIPPEHVAKTRAAYPQAESYLYPAGHGFNCDERRDFDPPSAALALERTLAFFATHLQSN